MLHEDTVFLRAGVLYYTIQENMRQDRVSNPLDPADDPVSDTQRDSSRTTGAAPYMSAGLLVPLGDSRISLTLDYNAYWLESERVNGINAGLSYRMK